MRTRMRFGAGALAAAGLLLAGGCAVAPPSTAVERDRGLAHRLAILGQIADPAAGEISEPVEGLAGSAARGAYRRYLGSYGGQEREAAEYTRPERPGGATEIREKSTAGGPEKSGR